jgi:hypothetical protein
LVGPGPDPAAAKVGSPGRAAVVNREDGAFDRAALARANEKFFRMRPVDQRAGAMRNLYQ